MATGQAVREAIMQRFVDALNEGRLPWRKPWRGGAVGRPHNATTRKPYRGSNAMYLGLMQEIAEYPTGGWLTFNQCQKLGGRVRKGEKGTGVVWWAFKEVEEDGGKQRTIPMARAYTVFNAAQTEGCDLPTPAPLRTVEPLDAAEAIITGWQDAPRWLTVDGDSAHYRPSTDTITLPPRGRFVSPVAYYATAYHEAIHATGHKSRLARDLAGYGQQYAQEELVAEVGAAFLLAEVGLDGTEVLDNSAAYVQGWASRLGSDPKRLLDAASAAQKAVDHILGVRWGEEAAE